MHVSVTRLRLGSWLTLPRFLAASSASARQAKASAGFVSGRTLLDGGLTFWTLTGWQTEEAMTAFRDSGAHRAVMPRLAQWCVEASVARMEAPDGALPDWSEAHRRMIGHGRASRLKRPSAAHARLDFAAPAAGAWRSRPF